ncbi:lipocalin family protein [Desulfuromonas sp. AOP6]|uniref:lipocalin family protein n=1 Tax=Desulfuromonas sp. AOP6 TaxID=1566351 RepID=UPI001282566B|nr:lipocalin family protein [Desulfuromonas sp. AOP6]BCA78754.1 hypothetical protein AOP6_0541 [Desulfuromonas sp. AOP6]
MKIRQFAAILLASSLALGGCGGGGGSSSETTSTVSGVVADGYLVGATVFLDKNGNMKLDEGEPTAKTLEGGKYTLEGTDLDKHPIIVLVTAGTIDEDSPTTPIENPYVLAAPAGKPAFISPVTTLVQSAIMKGQTLANAEASVQAAIGKDSATALYADYIEGADTVLHTVAQKIAETFAMVQTDPTVAQFTEQEQFVYATKIISENLTAIVADPVNFDGTTVAISPETEITASLGFTTENVIGKTFIAGQDPQDLVVFQLNADGTLYEVTNDTGTVDYMGAFTGTWSVTGGTLSMKYDQDGSTVTLNVATASNGAIEVVGTDEGGALAGTVYEAVTALPAGFGGTYSALIEGDSTPETVEVVINADGSGTFGGGAITWVWEAPALKIMEEYLDLGGNPVIDETTCILYPSSTGDFVKAVFYNLDFNEMGMATFSR